LREAGQRRVQSSPRGPGIFASSHVPVPSQLRTRRVRTSRWSRTETPSAILNIHHFDLALPRSSSPSAALLAHCQTPAAGFHLIPARREQTLPFCLALLCTPPTTVSNTIPPKSTTQNFFYFILADSTALRPNFDILPDSPSPSIAPIRNRDTTTYDNRALPWRRPHLCPPACATPLGAEHSRRTLKKDHSRLGQGKGSLMRYLTGPLDLLLRIAKP